ncbi:MAG: Wzz/FepE/Etk N-terminal domain-containing protein, partial [Anaerolineales bacterium]
MELRMYVRLLVRGWWIVVLTTLAALNIALVASLYATPLYRATARFLVSPNPALISSKDEINSLQALDKRTTVSTYAEVLNSGRLYNETLTALQIDAADVIDYSAAAVVLPETSVLELNVVGTDPQLVAQIAN